MKKDKCVICKEHVFKNFLEKNNADPVAKGNCCYKCNVSIVIPARLFLFK